MYPLFLIPDAYKVYKCAEYSDNDEFSSQCMIPVCDSCIKKYELLLTDYVPGRSAYASCRIINCKNYARVWVYHYDEI